MRRADRLFQITQILRNKRLVTAKQLAERLEVSERTIYRDIQDLSLSGVPIESEAGVGYMLRHTLDIPPIMFDADELEAIVLGVKMITAWSGNQLDKAAKSALEKIEAVVPEELRKNIETSKLFVPTFAIPNQHKANFEVLRQAINGKQVISVNYHKLNGEHSTRELWPLGMYYWGKVWTLVAWCGLRKAFRAFRVDRLQKITPTGEHYKEVDGRSLDDYVAIQRALYKQHKEWHDNQNYGQ
ncbi:MAG: YafY family transcriptional regulator [Kangiellaceae bacterium]|nr:YafY family transcriptional regulator [Kangiellaceae bacterium]